MFHIFRPVRYKYIQTFRNKYMAHFMETWFFQACIGKAREVRRPPTILRDSSTYRHEKAGRKFRLQVN